MSKIKLDLTKVPKEEQTCQNIRIGLMAELDAINLYEQLAANEPDPLVKKVFLRIAGEEKTHTGEFSTLLLEHDPEQAEAADTGEAEVEDLESD